MTSLFTNVKSLNLPKDQYAIFGSGPMAIRGLRKCNDIDIVVTDNLFENYKNRSEWKLKKFDDGSDYLSNDGIDFWKEWGPGKWDIQKLIDEAEIINGLPFVKVEEVLKWKRLCARPKDLTDIKLIEDYLAAKN